METCGLPSSIIRPFLKILAFQIPKARVIYTSWRATNINLYILKFSKPSHLTLICHHLVAPLFVALSRFWGPLNYDNLEISHVHVEKVSLSEIRSSKNFSPPPFEFISIWTLFGRWFGAGGSSKRKNLMPGSLSSIFSQNE